MRKVHINILDPIECEIDAKDAALIYEELSYEKTIWTKGKYKKTPRPWTLSAFSFNKGPTWRFWTGLLPRVKSLLENKNCKIVLIGDKYWNSATAGAISPKLKGETFRPYQKKFINDAILKTRGTIVSATGTGKTFIQLGIASCFPYDNILILVDKKVILNQTHEEAIKYFGKSRVQILENENKIKWLNICTRQKFMNLVIAPDIFTIIMIDETHHLSSFKCQFQEIMQNMLAPLRFGFTGTYPKAHEKERILALEAFIGPRIGEYSIEDAAEDNVLAIPKIKIIREDESQAIKKLGPWHAVNELGIINNCDHNTLVVSEAISDMEKGNTVLIFVNTVEHMLNLDMLFKYRPEKFRVKMVHSSVGKLPTEIKALEKKLDGLSVFLYMGTPGAAAKRRDIEDLIRIKKEYIRRLTHNAKRSEEYKQWLVDRKINGAIATSTWREGINIPSINSIYLAGGGKEARKILQEIGRGLRKTDDKKYVKIVDFFNPSHRFLIEHFGNRFCEYLDHKWEFIYE